MDIQITQADYERWIGQLYIQVRQLEKAVMALDKEPEKGIEVKDDNNT